MAVCLSCLPSQDIFLLLLVVSCTAELVRCFNLDLRFPVIKHGKNPDSLFGFSVALHQQTKGENRYLLLVGAPKEKAESHVTANETGGVYTCPISTDQSDCSRMNLIGSDKDLVKGDRVEGMWLGVTVASQRQPEGRVLACGHRFVKLYGVQELRQMIGKCYVRGNDLQDVSDWRWQKQVCNHEGEISDEVMCNMGISAAIVGDEVIFGSPGSYTWQGNVHVTWKNPKDEYSSKTISLNSLQRHHIYIGYSVAEDRALLSQDALTVVTGAPKDSKDDACGSVMLLTRTASANDQKEQLQPHLTLRGEQMGSYFGNALAITDLNNDGWNDLVVGAPFYFHKKLEQGGAVYVFMNEGGTFRQNASVTLRGPAGSAFGMSVVALGDINQDGFQDLAVGAPFHGTGSVSIWTGSAQGISTEPSQVIEGKDVGSGVFSTFGYSLSAGLDVDQNHYPDLLVGSLDNHVALLRARPVIHLNQTLRVSPEVVDPSQCDYCVEVEVCFSYTLSTGDKDVKKNITMQFTVNADLSRHNSRVRFQDNNQGSYTGFLSMPATRCRTLKLGLVTPLRDKVEPVKFALNVSVYQGQAPKQGGTLQNLDSFPVLSESRASPLRTEIHIQKECGLDNRCQSNLQMTAAFTNEQQVPFPSREGQQVFQYSTSVKKLLLVVHVTNSPSPGQPAEDAHNALLNMTIPPSLLYSGVRSESGAPVVGCAAENMVLLCELGNPFPSKQRTQIQLIFETSEISLDTKQINTQLQLSTLSEQSDLQPLPLVMVVEYSLEASFTLVKQTGLTLFSGEVRGESAMKTTLDVGSPVQLTFEVNINGKPLGGLGHLEVEFDWPWELANGKWLLYLTEIETFGTSDTHCVPPGDIVNPLELLLPEEETRKRRKREVESVKGEEGGETRAALNVQGRRKKTVQLDCVGGAARCVKFICPLRNMSRSARLVVKARLWNSTMLEDFTEAWRVTVKGLATLKLVTDKPTIGMDTQSREFTLQVDPELGEEAPYQAPLWIIIVSAVAGVLLLGLIIILMWKCGFFKRASTRKLYEAKAQKAQMKTQPSEVERLNEEH
ncbi:integrin alpha-3-like isoform X1 [Hypomesus transpacificus]|uniref:integrin alpha-3-like isoform X1 n=2 Tax=Hypomesus transpacificus TaxID=137520 RepID=UPI001F078838|nr:integrin alpha-3-like isoform X1 [Hypomesus transpacificus]